MLLNTNPIMIETLAQSLASDGMAPHEARVRAVGELAGRRGADSTCVSVLVDRSQPEVARLRAFGKIAQWFASTRPIRVNDCSVSTAA